METKSFRLAGLSSCYHTAKTKAIFQQHLNGSITDFVAPLIVAYAKELGFNRENFTMSKERAEQIQAMIDKSRGKDYTYLVAFEYLQWKRPGVSKSNLQRDAISSFC